MYKAGWAKQEICIQPRGFAMFGYGQWSHRAHRQNTALFARTICIREVDTQPWLIFCCLDLGCITSAIRLQIIDQLKLLQKDFDPEALVLTATHTHSSLGGCGFEALYNMPTPGFVPEHVSAIAEAVVSSVQNAISKAKDTELKMTHGDFSPEVDVAWNRSVASYNLNADVQPIAKNQTHLAVDREMKLLGFYQDQQLQAAISLFGVHATCLGNTLNAYDGDNKGYAASDLEERLTKSGVKHPVAIFAQGTAGDVSPHYHGPQQSLKRKKIKGEAEYQYAKQNGLYQSQLALNSFHNKANQTLTGSVDSILSYVDLTQVDIDPQFADGQKDAMTTKPCWGASFFAGTPVDGLGAAKPIVMAMEIASKYAKRKRLQKNNLQDLAYYKAQGNKKIVLEAQSKLLLGKSLDSVPNHVDKLVTEMNRQYRAGAIQESLLVPEVLPIQLIKIGSLVMVCCPGEITTIAGKRLKQAVKKAYVDSDIQVWLCSYCNDYMGYITTQEEYQNQRYEGGHTLYGQWTLAAFQTCFVELMQAFKQEKNQRMHDQSLQPMQPPQHELDKRTNRSY